MPWALNLELPCVGFVGLVSSLKIAAWLIVGVVVVVEKVSCDSLLDDGRSVYVYEWRWY